MLYTDLEKAFDKIPHKRLISKLSSYGLNKDITRPSWIEAFLLNWKQRVRVKETLKMGLSVEWYSTGITVGTNTIHYLHQRFSGTV